jgi:protein-L-isoaspartate(D-aspartate) O-methyltransferase
VNSEPQSLPCHQRRFVDLIEQSMRSNGVKSGLRPALREALLTCPRHLFVGRYVPFFGGPILDIEQGDISTHLERIYSEAVLGHVDGEGHMLPSTNSGPTLMLRLLELLDLRPGQRVLEIGSGSGWLLGLMARAVGPEGCAVGIEIIADLAERSRRSLAKAGIGNAKVVVGDGAAGWVAGAPYDRVIFTTGMWMLPPVFFAQVRDGGYLLAPFQIKGIGDDVLLLRRTGAGFRAEAALLAYFVRLAGGAADEAGAPRLLEDLPSWQKLRDREVLRVRMPLGGGHAEDFAQRTAAFRSYLTKIEPRLIAFGDDAPNAEWDANTAAFGVVDAAVGSLALCRPGELIGYGNARAAHDLLMAYREWTDLLMPGPEAFDTELLPTAAAPIPEPGQWIETRGTTVFVRSLKTDWPRAFNLVEAV